MELEATCILIRGFPTLVHDVSVTGYPPSSSKYPLMYSYNVCVHALYCLDPIFSEHVYKYCSFYMHENISKCSFLKILVSSIQRHDIVYLFMEIIYANYPVQ